jgi:predicted phosphodiesterase
MPRLAILADIHGNLPALEAVLADAAEWGAESVVVAGDAICWGPQSREVLELLAETEAICLRGNNEYYLLDWQTPRMPGGWRGYGLLPSLYEDCGEGWRMRIGMWPDTVSLRFSDAPPIRVWHGRPNDPWHGILPGDEVALDSVEESVLITGHTHVPLDFPHEGKRIVNPGSVGVPLDGDRRASYARFDAVEGNWRITHRRVEYDVAKLEAAFERTSFLRRNGSLADLVKKEFDSAELQVIPFLTFRAKEDLSEADARERFTDEVRLRYTPRIYHRTANSFRPGTCA